MLIKIRNIRQMWKNNHASSHAETSLLKNPAEQTRASWARSVKSYAAVPDVYKKFFKPFLAEEREFPYTILTPAFDGFMHTSTEKLICDFGNEIYILERNGNTFETQCYPVETINYVKVRTVLLDTRIMISGWTKDALLATSNLKFNSATDYLFAPILKSIRFVAVKSKDAAQSSELDKFNQFAESHYKFMNYGRHSLLGEEKVLCSILQAEIQKGRFKRLTKIFYKIITPAHLSILTDRELIMIREERQPGGGKYGCTWEYIPLGKIAKLAVNETDENLLVLSVQLLDKTLLEYIFQVSARSEIDQLVDGFMESTKG